MKFQIVFADTEVPDQGKRVDSSKPGYLQVGGFSQGVNMTTSPVYSTATMPRVSMDMSIPNHIGSDSYKHPYEDDARDLLWRKGKKNPYMDEVLKTAEALESSAYRKWYGGDD
jgi:hypothetical protein